MNEGHIGACIGKSKVTNLVFVVDVVNFAESLYVLVWALEAVTKRQPI